MALWDVTGSIRLCGTFLRIRAGFELVKRRGSGAIISISSIWGKERWSNMARWPAAAYCALESGVNGFAQALSYEWQRSNIRVNSVCPGLVDTAHALRAVRDGDRILPEDVARLVVFLASREAKHLIRESMVAGQCGSDTMGGSQRRSSPVR